jgi:outer membrane protein
MRKLLTLALLLSITSMAFSQKIGHLNSGNVLALMPEVGKADSVLKIYQRDLMLKRDTIIKLFESEYKAYVGAKQAGTLSAVQDQKRQESLQKQQQAIQQYGQSVEENVGILKKQLLQPILFKLDEAIQAIGKEGNYQIILDTSTGSSLFASESDDIMPQVKTKLNLK